MKAEPRKRPSSDRILFSGCAWVCACVRPAVQARRGEGGGLAGLPLVVQRFQAPLKSALGGFQGQGVAAAGTPYPELSVRGRSHG